MSIADRIHRPAPHRTIAASSPLFSNGCLTEPMLNGTSDGVRDGMSDDVLDDRLGSVLVIVLVRALVGVLANDSVLVIVLVRALVDGDVLGDGAVLGDDGVLGGVGVLVLCFPGLFLGGPKLPNDMKFGDD